MSALTIIDSNKTPSGDIRVPFDFKKFEQLLSLSVLCNQEMAIHDVTFGPHVHAMIQNLEFLGMDVGVDEKKNIITTDSSNINTFASRYNSLISKNHVLFLFMSMLSRFGKAGMPKEYLDDFQVVDWEQLGISVQEDQGFIVAQVPENWKDVENYIYDVRNLHVYEELFVTILSVLRTGVTTTIREDVTSTEAPFVISSLRQMGANIESAVDTITVVGVDELHVAEYNVPADSFIVGILLTYVGMRGGDVQLLGVDNKAMISVLTKMQKIGIQYKFDGDKLRVWHSDEEFKPINITIDESQNIASPWALLFVILFAHAQGESTIENITDKKVIHAIELMKEHGMTATIMEDDGTYTVTIFGPSTCQHDEVQCENEYDVLAAVLMSFCQREDVVINNYDILDERFPNVLLTLESIGLDIRKES